MSLGSMRRQQRLRKIGDPIFTKDGWGVIIDEVESPGEGIPKAWDVEVDVTDPANGQVTKLYFSVPQEN